MELSVDFGGKKRRECGDFPPIDQCISVDCGAGISHNLGLVSLPWAEERLDLGFQIDIIDYHPFLCFLFFFFLRNKWFFCKLEVLNLESLIYNFFYFTTQFNPLSPLEK